MSDKVSYQSLCYSVHKNADWSIQLGLHRISNPDPDDFAISLHREPESRSSVALSLNID